MIYRKLCRMNRKIDPIVYIIGSRVSIPYAGRPYVRLICKDQRRRNIADRDTGSLVVIANGGNHFSNLVGSHLHPIQNPERHHRSRLRVIDPIDQIADVVEITCDFGQLCGAIVETELLQEISGSFRNSRDVSKAMLGVA